MRVYHRSAAGQVIVEEGFADSTGTYLTDRPWTGVWVSDRPLDENEGAEGDDLLAVEIPEEVIVEFEWVQESAWVTESGSCRRAPSTGFPGCWSGES